MENTEKLRVYLADVLKGLCSHPDDVEVIVSQDEMGVLYTVKIHEEDRGSVIGKEGANAKAVKTLLRSIGFRMDVRASLKFDIPERPSKRSEYKKDFNEGI